MAVPKNWPKLFIDELRRSANVKGACAAAGVKRTAPYERRARDLKFAAEWDSALEDACDLLEAEAQRRAIGYDRSEPVWLDGKHIGEKVTREHSDTLLIFLLKAHRPEKFRERFDVKHSGKVEHEHYNLEWADAVISSEEGTGDGDAPASTRWTN